MKTHLLTLALALGLLPLAGAAPLSFPDITTARKQAEEAGKPILMLWYGSDWMEEAETLNKEWTALASLAEAPLPVIFALFDEKTGLTDDDRKKAAIPLNEFNLPIAVLFAPDGTLMATYRGKAVLSAATIQQAVTKSLSCLPQFMEAVKQARSSQGMESVMAAGKALDQLTIKDAWRHRELTKIISDRDPEDKSGYYSKYCLEHMGMYKRINTILKGGEDGQLSGKERKFDAAEQYVQGVISRQGGKQPKLDVEQQQQWLAGLYYIQKERMLCSEEKDRTQVLATLQRIIKLNPKNEYGKGAASFHRYWDPKSFFVVENGFYEARHQTLGFEKDWHVDVTNQVKGPGTYNVAIVPTIDNAFSTRNFRIVVNGKEVSRANVDEKTITKTVEIEIPKLPRKAKVELWLTAQCHDGWLNCAGRIEVKKK